MTAETQSDQDQSITLSSNDPEDTIKITPEILDHVKQGVVARTRGGDVERDLRLKNEAAKTFDRLFGTKTNSTK